MILALVVSLGILVFGYGIENYLLEKFPFLMKYQDSMVVLPTGLALVILALLFAVLYTYLPNRKMAFIRQLPGAVFTSVAWAVFSYVFSIYLEYASNMSVLYGSLTTLVVVKRLLVVFLYVPAVHRGRNQPISECTGAVYP